MATAKASQALPGNYHVLENIRGMAQRGFIGYVGDQWAQHGDLFVIDLGMRKLTFAFHPDAVRQINITHRQNYEKLKSYDSVRRYLLGRGLVASTGDLWRQQRKLMAPFYTPRAVQVYGELMLRDGQTMIQRWERAAATQQTIDMPLEMATITASIILRAMFSMETDEEVLSVKEDVESMVDYVSSRNFSLLPLPVWVPTAHNRRYSLARTRIHKYINALIARRQAVSESEWPDDLLTRLMQARDEETGHTMDEDLLRDEAITTFFAGHETTARTLTFIWYALAQYPQVAARLHNELDTVLGNREATLSDLHHLPYTLQVVKEALRLYTPAPFYVRDAIEADVIDGYTIPAGTALMLSPYYTHRHPDFWDDALTFNPDRWTPEREAAMHPQAYHPFATGQRICIGNNFSLLESHILLALLARRFTADLLTGYQPQWVMQGTLGLQNGLPMRLHAREGHVASQADPAL